MAFITFTEMVSVIYYAKTIYSIHNYAREGNFLVPLKPENFI
jgi:hypothetical protein